MQCTSFVETDGRSYFKVHRDAYVNSDVWRTELFEVFDRCWLYAGHDSELASTGAFVARQVGGRPLILARGEDGQIRAFLNACAHRGAAVCPQSSGVTQRFSCPYHGWAYDTAGKLIGLPGYSAYRCDGGLPSLGLTAVNLQAYRGFLFVSFGKPTSCLVQYLGQAAAYIDMVLDQSQAPLQIIPGAAHHAIHANWKLLAENGVDAYHLPHAHKRFLDFLNTLGADPASHKRTGVGLALGNGHAVIKSGPPSTGRPIAYWSPLFPESMKPVIERRYAALVETHGLERAQDIALTNRSLFIFPNLVVNDILGLNIRTFFPSGPAKVDVTVWGAGFADETEEERAMRIDGLISFIGPGGLGTPDDIEILESCQRAYAHGGIGYSDFSRGLVPGTSYHTDEAQNREFWIEWTKRMQGAPV